MSINTEIARNLATYAKEGFKRRLLKDLKRNKHVYIMVIPVVLFYLLFCYKPMYGALIAFKNYNPSKGIWGSPWVGFKHFAEFFQSYYFIRILKNTLVISISNLIFGFPAPIILALLLNEMRNGYYKRIVQTVSYLPHFIALVVVCGIIKSFTTDTGLINYIIGMFGGKKVTMLNVPGLFVPIYVVSDIWQGIGWGSIIYIAAITGISPELYEAAVIDGANRWKQILNVTLPGIMPTIIVLLILRMGNILNVGFEKIILLYNPAIYETSDVISSFVYRKGLLEFNWSYSSAIGLFNSLINLTMLFGSNWLSRKVNQTSLW